MNTTTVVLMIIFVFTFVPLALAEIARAKFRYTIEDFFLQSRRMNLLMAFFTIYAKKALRERKIPFEITAAKDPFYSESNLRAIDEADERVKNGHYVVKTIEELEAMANA